MTLWLLNLVSLNLFPILLKFILPIVVISELFNIPKSLYDGRTKEVIEYDRTHNREYGWLLTR